MFGVPWRRERYRDVELNTNDHKEQQCDPIHDHESASRPAPEPLDSTERSRKRRSREVGEKARNKKYKTNGVAQRDDCSTQLSSMFLPEGCSEPEGIQAETQRATD